MIDRATRWWDSLTSTFGGLFGGRFGGDSDDKADPRLQLEQAIVEAQHQHKRLKDQAASVIANQKQAEIRLNTKLGELEKLNRTARQALLMAADAERSGDGATAEQYGHAAETIADKLISVEADVESLKTMVLESTQATDQAKAAVKTNSRLLQEKLAEKSKQLSQLEQAKMQEEMNAAMAQLSETVGDDVPTFAEVEAKIEARYARATAAAEQQQTSPEHGIEEIEEATATDAAKERVADLRAQLGLT
ncbi:MAG: PspA/IM30 family protein [Ilumatobacteraceae bacterium]